MALTTCWSGVAACGGNQFLAGSRHRGPDRLNGGGGPGRDRCSRGRRIPKPLTDEVLRAADYVITMWCGGACPIYPGRRYMDWPVADPIGQPLEEVRRRIRGDITARFEGLVSGDRHPARMSLPKVILKTGRNILILK